jgi:hypothetical protein
MITAKMDTNEKNTMLTIIMPSAVLWEDIERARGRQAQSNHVAVYPA